MQNGLNTMTNTRRHRPARKAPSRAKQWAPGTARNPRRPNSNNPQNARANYERYLALAQAEVQSGNTIGAENFYQHAEHYFRSMSGSDPEAT